MFTFVSFTFLLHGPPAIVCNVVRRHSTHPFSLLLSGLLTLSRRRLLALVMTTDDASPSVKTSDTPHAAANSVSSSFKSISPSPHKDTGSHASGLAIISDGESQSGSPSLSQSDKDPDIVAASDPGSSSQGSRQPLLVDRGLVDRGFDRHLPSHDVVLTLDETQETEDWPDAEHEFKRVKARAFFSHLSSLHIFPVSILPPCKLYLAIILSLFLLLLPILMM